MRLRDYFRSKRQLMEQLSDAQREAEVNGLMVASQKEENEQLLDKLMTVEYRLESTETDVEILRLEKQTLQSILRHVHPKLQTVEIMKEFYETVSPLLDKDGFQLYWAAKAITGINVCNEYAYEDARGVFEEMDGWQMLSYLEAIRFRAVEWEVVPGISCEEAALLPVDTTTKEYRAYEEQLYAKVLDQLGFDVTLPEPNLESLQKKQNKGDMER